MTEIGIERDLLPAWFTERMMDDQWHFGLLTVTGHLFYVQTINAIRQDASSDLWLDVESWDDAGSAADSQKLANMVPVHAPTSRTKATIKASHIVAAFELADT